MLTDEQIAELRRLCEPDSEIHTPDRFGKLAFAVPALLSERALLVAVAEAADQFATAANLGAKLAYLEVLDDALSAWRTARDGGKETT